MGFVLLPHGLLLRSARADATLQEHELLAQPALGLTMGLKFYTIKLKNQIGL
jgi:hypothetical protein